MQKHCTTQKRPRKRYSVSTLKSWKLDRQLNLMTYLEAYRSHFRAQYTHVLEQPDGLAEARDQTLRCVENNARKKAETVALYDGLPSWQLLRHLIYKRDKGVCWACGRPTPWTEYELSHLVDQCVGGLDIPDNLVAMCAYCNRMKPVHRSVAEVVAWRDAGGAMVELDALIRAVGTSLSLF